MFKRKETRKIHQENKKTKKNTEMYSIGWNQQKTKLIK